jgi:4-amino-4-deoxy-L-arabinose transferase-like glycosyltransferase
MVINFSLNDSIILNNIFVGKNIAIIITLIFFSILFYVAFFHHTVWHEQDGIFYLLHGKEIFAGNSQNLQLVGAPIGTPIIYATLDDHFGNAFEIIKGISLISGTSIVILSYFIVKNIFGVKIALISQIIVAINPKLQLLSISTLNELLPISLIIASFYFLTKNELKNSHFIIMGILLGLSFMMRYQSVFIILGILLFLLIRNRNFSQNAIHGGILVLMFVVVASPVLIFNYMEYGQLVETDTSFYFLALFEFQNLEWRESLQNMKGDGTISLIFTDPNLFAQNYFFNLFNHNPDKLFNFGSLGNLSILPLIPILGFITVALGFLHTAQLSKDYRLWISFIASGVIGLLIFFIGDIAHHYFALILIPLIIFGIFSLKKIKSNLLPLFVVSIVFYFSLSIFPVYREYHFLPLLITFSILNSIFIVRIFSKLFSKQRFLENEKS